MKTESFANHRTYPLRVFLPILALAAIVFSLGAADARAEANGRNSAVRATLDNGLRVVIVRNPLAPVATVVMNYQVGSNETPKGFPGTAHALEHMMFRGSPDLSADQLADISAAMGGDFDADTQQAVTQYFFTVPAEDLELALRIEAIRMRGLSGTKELWEQERGAIEQEVAQDLSNPQYVFYTRLLEALFRGTPYEHDALGTRPSFDQTTAEALRQFHETWYVPNNAILVIVGDVDPQQTLSSVRKLYAGIPSKKLPARPPVELQPVKPDTLRLTTDLPYGMAVIAVRLPGFDSADFAAVDVLGDVLSSERGRLYDLVAKGKALSAEFSYEALPKAGIGYAVATFPRDDDGQALVEQVRRVLADELNNGVSADLVEAAKRHELADEEFQKNSVSGLAMEWSQALAVEGRQSPEDDIEAIKQVTVDDVNRVARKYLDLDHAIVAILTPQPSGKPVSSKGFGGKESFAPKQVKPVPLPDWAEKSLKKLAIPASTVHPYTATLRNGIQLIVQRETTSRTISVYGGIRNKPDLEVPNGKEGVDQVLGKLFSFGTTSLDRVAFQKALDDIGAEASAGTDFSLRTLKDHFERGVQLLADNELHPALPEEAFPIIQKQTAGRVAGLLQSPDYLVMRALRTALFPKDDPSLRQATPATVHSLALEDVKNYYQHVFRPDLTTIVVIGDIEPKQARKIIERYFGDWKASGPKPETRLPRVPLNKPAVTAVPDSSRVQDKVTLAETLGLTRSDPDYYALELGNHVLGGAFYATRLYKDLRQHEGLVYFVESIFQMSRTRGIYLIEYACDPPNVSKVRAISERDLRDMQKEPVTPKELQQAKALLLREIPLQESSVSSIANGLLHRSLEELPLDEPTRAAHRYFKLNAGQVRAAYAKWLRPDDLVQVTQGPTPQ